MRCADDFFVLTKTSAAGAAVIDEPETKTKGPVKPAVDTQKKTALAQARELTIYLDGKFVPESEAEGFGIRSRPGLLYGDGIFEENSFLQWPRLSA